MPLPEICRRPQLAVCTQYWSLCFPPILIVFSTGIAIYITRAPCIGGGRGWGVGRVAAKKLKNSADLVAVDLPRWNRPKWEESTIDRMAILPTAAMLTKKRGTLVRPTQSPTLKSLTTLTSAQCIYYTSLQVLGTLLYSIFMYLIMYAL